MLWSLLSPYSSIPIHLYKCRNLYIFFHSLYSFKIEYKWLFYDIYAINFNATSNYNADFLIHNSLFYIHDSFPHLQRFTTVAYNSEIKTTLFY